MKKIFSAVACAAVIGWAGTAMTVPKTWVDTVDLNNPLVNTSSPVSFIHDITDQGFVPGSSFVYDYNLEIALYDDGSDGRESAWIDLPGYLADGRYNFDYTSDTFGMSLAGFIMINALGKLDVTISATRGDFIFDYSTLTANGTAPVPEPTTMLLFGTGLLGLAAVGRRRKA